MTSPPSLHPFSTPSSIHTSISSFLHSFPPSLSPSFPPFTFLSTSRFLPQSLSTVLSLHLSFPSFCILLFTPPRFLHSDFHRFFQPINHLSLSLSPSYQPSIHPSIRPPTHQVTHPSIDLSIPPSPALRSSIHCPPFHPFIASSSPPLILLPLSF